MLADARVLHSAYRNQTDERRTLVLAWHRRPDTVPAYWTDEVPAIIAERDPEKEYPGSRIPWRASAIGISHCRFNALRVQ